MVPKVQHAIATKMKANGETVVPTKDYQTAEGRALWGDKFKKTLIDRTYKIVCLFPAHYTNSLINLFLIGQATRKRVAR